MSNLIAKRYVKALLIDRNISDIAAIYSDIKDIATAYSNDRFLSIIASTEVSTDKKINLINSFIKTGDNKVVENLLKLLAENKRLDIIPNIADELKKEIAILNNSYEGIVYTNIKLKSNDLSDIQNKFAKKFDIKLSLTQNICNYDGIKVDIEGLGVEIGFSKDRFKSQMIEHILKAV
jgi:F-type H+-transporting ATPase subunit delta